MSTAATVDRSAPAIDRLLDRVVAGPNGCWIWTGPPLRSTNPWQKPYSILRVNGKKMMGHRLAYEHFVGPIPEGMQIDHLCKQTLCVNPAHLEPVTQAESIARGYWGTRTHCKNGHEFNEKNTGKRRDGSRVCRKCASLATAAYLKRKKAVA